MLYVNFVNVLITKDVFLVMLMTINGYVSIVLVVYFRLIIILDDNEFRYSLHYFHNSIEYNRLLSLKLNPLVFDDFINDNTANELVNPPSDNSCNYMFDCSLDDIDVSFKNVFFLFYI